MKPIRIGLAILVSVVGFFYLLVAYAFIGWGWSDSYGGWTPTQWILNVLLWSPPFLVSLWIVYRCCDSSLKLMFVAEIAGLAIVFLLGVAYTFRIRDFPVLVEQNPPLTEIRDSGRRPALPLAQPAVGIEAADGKFIPMLNLSWPPPGWGFQDLTFDLKTGAPEVAVYRGTNELVANDHFLGKFQIVGYRKSKQSLDVLLFFQISDTRQLLLIAREQNTKTHLKLQRIDAKSNP
jgi:hypothetical protein